MKPDPRPLGLYIHIPFCKSKCAYCDFYSLSNSEGAMDAYAAALSAHLAEVAPRAACYTVDTVYFGGGTPSYFGAERLTRLLKTIRRLYRVAKDAEITLEANPDSAREEKALRLLRRAGFNRISLGVQSTDDAMLRTLGRVHSFADVTAAVAAARGAGFQNLSLDLIYGLPGQRMEQWQKTLADALALSPEHLSCYGLKIEEGTPFFARQSALDLPDDDAQADLYLAAVETLARAGYEQYEISNFAKPGFASRHNLKYWTLREYAGFGPGAHSDLGGVRFAYEKDLGAYLRGALRLSEETALAPLERDTEYLMLGLRLTAGVSGEEFTRRFRQRFEPLETLLRQYESAGYAREESGRWRLTPTGFLVSNQIIGGLLEVLSREKERRAAWARGERSGGFPGGK